MTRLLQIEGLRFGRLVATSLLAERRNKKAVWRCQCDCGKVVDVVGYNLTAGITKSCGCYKADSSAPWRLRHGECYSPEHRIWCGVTQRCTNQNNHAYDRYGARGITVCERWMSFENFLADMGRRPTTSHSLDRIDNDKGYSPENCRWATSKEQGNNCRSNVVIEHNGESHTLTQWAEKVGIRMPTLWKRLRASGWSIERALTTPARAR